MNTKIAAAATVALLALAGCGGSAALTRTSTTPASTPTCPYPAGSAACAVATPPPAPTPAATTTAPAHVTLRFSVTGSGQPSITYGSDSDSISPPGGLGAVGDGVALPWHAALSFDPSAQYYDLSAQLQGSGSITCKITVSAGARYSTLTYTGHASGGYNICDVQIAPGLGSTSGLSWTKE